MTVTEQGHQQSLGVTQDEGIPIEVLPNDRLAAVVNSRVRKPGALSKRYGYSAYVRTRLDTGSAITKGKRLIRRDDELAFTDGSYLYSYSAGLARWVPRDRMPEGQVLRRQEQVGDIKSGSIYATSVAHLFGQTCVFYQRVDNTGPTAETWARVFRDDTLISETRLSVQATTNVGEVITCGSFFVVVRETGAGVIEAWRWDTLDASAPAWVGPTTLRNDTDASGLFALAEIPALSQFALVYQRTGAGNELDVYTYNSSLVQQNFAPNQRAGKNFTHVGAHVVGTTLVIAIFNSTDSNVEALGLVASTLAAGFAPVTIGSTSDAIGPLIVGERTSLSAWVLYGSSGSLGAPFINQMGIRYRGVSVPGGAADATTYNSYNCANASRIFNYGGQSYVIVHVVPSIASTGSADLSQDALVCVSLGADEVLGGDTNYRVRPIARWGEGEFFQAIPLFITRVVPGATTGTFHAAHTLTDRDFNKLGAQRGAAVDVTTLNFDDIAATRWVGQSQIGGDTLIPAGLLHCYDGELCFEAGFTYYPVIRSVPVEYFNGTPGLPDGTYEYRVVFAKRDKQGRIWRSRPSNPVSATVPQDTNDSVRLRITHYSITSMHDSAQGFFHPVVIEVYRRSGSGPFVRLAKSSDATRVCDPSDPTSQPYYVFDDDGTWNTTNQPELYTTGGVLDINTPPPCRFSSVFNNRLFLAGCDDDERVPYSREVLFGEGAYFNNDQGFRVDEGQGINALAVQDSSLLLFKDDNDGIFFIQGSGPNDQGLENGYSDPQKIANAHGNIEPRSILTTTAGTFFQSRRGIERIGRGEGVSLFGHAVEDTLAQFGEKITSCIYEPSSGETRWSVSNGSTGQFLVYTEPTQTWARDVLFGANSTAAIDAAMVGGIYHWLDSSGYVYREENSGFDANVEAGTTSVVSSYFKTGDIALEGPLGKCSYFRIALLGRRIAPHGLSVTITLDQGQTLAGTKSFTAGEVGAFKWIPIEIPLVNLTTIQGRSIRVEVNDSPTDETGFGPVWFHLLVEYGTEGRKYQKLPVPPVNRK